MCTSAPEQNKHKSPWRRLYDDHTSRRFDRSRIETELFNFFVDEEDCHDTPHHVGREDCIEELPSSEDPVFTDLDRDDENAVDACRNVVKGRQRNQIHDRYSNINEKEPQHNNLRVEDALNNSLNSMFSSFDDIDFDDDNSLDPLFISLDLENIDLDESTNLCSSQISYDDSSFGSSTDDMISIATESQSEYNLQDQKRSFNKSLNHTSFTNSPRSTRGIFMLNDEIHKESCDRSSNISFTLNSSCRSARSILTLNEEAELESQTAIGYSRGSSRYTTDSPKILELRERKRLMERSHEKKYSKFPTLIELDTKASFVY